VQGVGDGNKEVFLDGVAIISESETEWRKHRIMINVPSQTLYISFGVRPTKCFIALSWK
jgi:hypothetical protein